MDVYTRNLAQSVVLLDQRPETRIYLGSLKDGIVTLEDVQNIPNSNQSRRNGKLNRVADRRAASPSVRNAIELAVPAPGLPLHVRRQRGCTTLWSTVWYKQLSGRYSSIQTTPDQYVETA